MPTKLDDLHLAKRAVAILVTSLVETLAETDPTIKGRFLKKMETAYYKARDDSDVPDERHTFEMLNWTRELLTGFSRITGQGEPHFSD